MKNVNLNRKTKRQFATKSAAVLMAAAVSIGAFAPALNTVEAKGTNKTTAGSIVSIREISSLVARGAQVNEEGVIEVAETSEPEVTVQYPEWQNKLMPKVEDYLSVRTGASTDTEVIGKLYKGDVADITSVEDGWYGVTSGKVTGYVNADYVVTGDEAYLLSEEVCTKKAVSTTAGLRVRESASTDANVVLTLDEGEKISVNKEAEAVEGWIAVKSKSGKTGYVSAEYATVETVYGTGITIEEENVVKLAKAIEKKRAEEAAAAKAAAKSSGGSSSSRSYGSTGTVQGSAVAADVDDVTLLAALIQLEAGPSDYEGDLAVGAVVVNRIKDGRFPSTVRDVIYQRGQFPPSKRIPNVLAKGVSSTCIAAAQAALAGADNTGGCIGFNDVSSGRSGTVIGGNVFFH